MNFKYPQGTNNIPTTQFKENHGTTNFAKRGMSLEAALNDSNRYYLSKGIAVIHKKPTPIQIVKVDYPKRSAAKIREAYFRQASTTDYNGVYKGKYIDFDAKETTNINSFPLKNFHKHQIEHMRRCIKAGGICFAIIKFVKLNQIYLLKASDLFYFWDEADSGGRKSIPLSFIAKNGVEILPQLNPQVPYLTAVDKIMK